MHKIKANLAPEMLSNFGDKPLPIIGMVLDSLDDDFTLPPIDIVRNHIGTKRIDIRVDADTYETLRQIRQKQNCNTSEIVVGALIRHDQVTKKILAPARPEKQPRFIVLDRQVNDKCPGGKYMNASQLAWFKIKLEGMLKICERSIEDSEEYVVDGEVTGDDADLSDHKIESVKQHALQNRLHSHKREIKNAIFRIESGEYGYCEESGDEIGLPRLQANPLARLTIEMQERRERMARTQGAAR